MNNQRYKKDEIVMLAVQNGLDYLKFKKMNANDLKRALSTELSKGIQMNVALENIVKNTAEPGQFDEAYPKMVKAKSVVKK